MKKLYFIGPKFLYKNEIFNLQSKQNWDNALYPFYLLKEKFKEKGIELQTYDYYKKGETDYALLFQDFPKNIDEYIKDHPTAKKFLFIYESPIVRPENQTIENYKHFDKVFTWNTKLVDNKKIFRLSYARKIPQTLDIAAPKTKLATGAFGYKFQTNPVELYSERIRAIRWFEANHPNDFDLYGYGWNERYFTGAFKRLNKFKILKKIFAPHFPSYKGFVDNKKDVYSNYRFVICYENSMYPDYVTEKILDCLLCGSVPIYLGAPNVTDFIPENAFVDKRKFASYEDLYSFLKNMPEEKYQEYLTAIKNFVEGEKMYPFSADCFAKTLTEEISKSII